jgi:SHS2 domain-containing protein
MGYTLLDHTSEIGFEAAGKTLEAAFSNAGKAVFDIMTDTGKLSRDTETTFTVESENLEALLFDFVDELIYLSQADRLLLRDFDTSITETADGYRLACTGAGQPIDDQSRLQEIKAPTYSDIIVDERAEGWYLRMFVDV